VVNNKEHCGEIDMQAESVGQILTEKETVMAFNMGLQTAIYILEKAEKQSAEGRRLLIEELRKQIANSE